jgi:hypothetical protein
MTTNKIILISVIFIIVIAIALATLASQQGALLQTRALSPQSNTIENEPLDDIATLEKLLEESATNPDTISDTSPVSIDKSTCHKMLNECEATCPVNRTGDPTQNNNCFVDCESGYSLCLEEAAK